MSNRLNYLRMLVYAVLLSFPFTTKGQIDSSLLAAVKNCNIQEIQRLSSNININTTDSNGANALMWAAYYCDVPIVMQLVQQGAKVVDTGVIYEDASTSNYFTSLQGIAAALGKLELLTYFADSLHLSLDEKEYDPYSQKKNSWTPLCWAINSGQTDVVNYLLQKGANVHVVNNLDCTTPLIIAAAYAGEQKDWSIFDLLIQNGGKEKLGNEAENIIRSANELSQQGQAKADYNQQLKLQQLILQLRKIYFGETHLAYAISLNEVAYLYYITGRYDKALPLYEQALTIAKRTTTGEDVRFYGSILHSLAYLYKQIGQDEKALSFTEQATVIAKKVLGENHPDYATSLQSLASLYRDMGQYDKALPLYEQSATIRKKALGEESSAYALSLLEMGNLYQQMNQYEKATELYQQAITIRRKVLGEEDPAYANSLKHLASLFHQMGQYEKALPLYEQAVAINKKALGEEHPDYIQTLNDLALLYQDMQQYDKALFLFSQTSANTLSHLALTYTTLSEQEKMALLHKKVAQFSYLPSLLFKQGIHQSPLLQQVFTNELALKGMVLEDQKAVFNSIRNSKDSVALHLYEQWSDNKAFLGKQLLLPIKERAAYLDSLVEATDQLEQQLSQISTAFRSRQQQQHLTPKDIAQKLKKGEAAIEFINFRIYNKKLLDSVMYAALMLAPGDTVVHFIPLFEEKQLQHLLESAADTTPYAIVEKLYGKKRTKSISDSLYQLIWKPLEQYLQDVHTVYYAPTGLLHRFAFQALPTDSGNLLIDKYQLNQLLSTRSLASPVEITSKPASVQIWGNIAYSASNYPDNNIIASHKLSTRSLHTADTTISSFNLYTEDTKAMRGRDEGWVPLLFTRTEMDSINTIFTRVGIIPKSFSGALATEEAFKAMSGKSPQVLHLATHGFFLPTNEKNKSKEMDLNGSDAFTMQQDPMFRSGLVLAGANHTWKGEPAITNKEDGILTAYEIAQLDLTGTDMVVLSACETALGDISGTEGVIGLQRALKMAGVKQMILSLWKVPDKPTMELMATFYRNWLGGQTTREALHNAQLQLKAEYKHPYFWAAFVLVE